MYKSYQIAPDVHWVGVLEWDERCIHGFNMAHGSTNNSYLIIDDKITLIDTCTPGYEKQLLERISDVVDPTKIDYIISNHGEKDHAGSLAKVLESAPNATVVTSAPQGEKILRAYFGDGVSIIPVKTGDSLEIGNRTLSFVQTPMVHWPDNMVTYSAYDKILFSNDAFGQFLATSKRFDDETDMCEVMAYAKKYFANIVFPFIKQTSKALEAVEPLDISMIAPSHGIIWRSHIQEILSAYKQWCSNEPTESAVVVFSTMYGSTERMAEAITEAFMYKGVDVRLFDLRISDISDVITYVMDAKYLAVGSPTHNAQVLPEVGGFLTYLKGLGPKGRIGISFGSYGWMCASTKEISAALEATGYELPLEPFEENWNEDDQAGQAIFDAIVGLVDAD